MKNMNCVQQRNIECKLQFVKLFIYEMFIKYYIFF